MSDLIHTRPWHVSRQTNKFTVVNIVRPPRCRMRLRGLRPNRMGSSPNSSRTSHRSNGLISFSRAHANGRESDHRRTRAPNAHCVSSSDPGLVAPRKRPVTRPSAPHRQTMPAHRWRLSAAPRRPTSARSDPRQSGPRHPARSHRRSGAPPPARTPPTARRFRPG